MNNKVQNEAVIAPVKKISPIWFVPIVALLIGFWMLFYQWNNQGVDITLVFSSAEGIQVGKTKIKNRSIDVGVVTSIEIDEDSSGVIVSANISKSAKNLLIEDSLFWLVSPKVTLKEITGLNTLLSGAYIELAKGKSETFKKSFTALKSPPVTPVGTPGLHITLNSADQFSYQVGDPIIYKGLTVGKFEDIYFNFDERIVYYNAFINEPYHQLITSNTKFWDISGIRIDLNSKGVSINTGNIDSLLTNGVTFGLLNSMPKGEQVTERAFFDIYESYERADEQRHNHFIELLLYVKDSVRGLHEGAVVEYKGIPVGQVTSINFTDQANQNNILTNVSGFEIPIIIKVVPARFGFPDDEAGVNLFNKQINNWLGTGLKAKLQAGNMLTGSLFINLLHEEVSTTQELRKVDGYRVIASIGDDLSQLTAKASQFLDNLNSMPLDKLSNNANTLIEELTATSKDLQQASKNISGLLTSAQEEALMTKLSNAFNNIALLTKDLSSDSKIYKDANKTLLELNDLLYELKPLINQLNKQPNSLIFNKGKMEDIEPKKYQGKN